MKNLIMKNEQSLIDILSSNIPKEVIRQKEIIQRTIPDSQALDVDTEVEYEFAQKQIKELLQHSNESIESLLEVARESQHPRAFEVLAQLLKISSDMSKDLLNLQKSRKELLQKNDPPKGTPPGGNTFIFNGTTTDLLDTIIKRNAPSISNE